MVRKSVRCQGKVHAWHWRHWRRRHRSMQLIWAPYRTCRNVAGKVVPQSPCCVNVRVCLGVGSAAQTWTRSFGFSRSAVMLIGNAQIEDRDERMEYVRLRRESGLRRSTHEALNCQRPLAKSSQSRFCGTPG
jgi:hypothetical protein